MKEGKIAMKERKIRVLLTKGGLDGHDRGILVVAQALRDAKIEVVYGGLYRSPEEIAAMALGEDVDMVGISILSGAHLGVFSEVLRILQEKTGKDWFVFGGGVVPQKDIPVLENMGVKKIFLPGTDTNDIVKFVLEAKLMKKNSSLLDLTESTKRGEVLAASRLMTFIRKGSRRAKKLVSEFPNPQKETLLIGVTGPGGVGKSTLINKLIYYFRQENKTVGVVSCDPVSLSGGAFLGDRIRMQEHTLDPGVFVRSVAQYKNFKGVTSEIPSIIKIFGALKKDVIIVETVGVGQEDLGFKDLVDTLLLVLMPGLGDEIQMLKGGVIQTADILVVNKSELIGGDVMARNLLSYFGNIAKPDDWQPKIYKTSSISGEGIPELLEGIKEHKKFLLNKAAQ